MTNRNIYKKVVTKFIFFLGNLLFKRPYETNFKRKLFKFFFKSKIKVFPSKKILNLNLFKKLSNDGYFQMKNKEAIKHLNDHKNIIQICNDILSTELKFIKNQKDYLKTIDLKKVDLNKITKIYKYITQDYFINIANSYLETSSHLVELKILISPVNLKKNLSGSQEWHSDFDDINNLKLFIYLDDIGDNHGPLQVVKKPISQLIMKNKNYKWGKGNSHNDSLLEKNNINKVKHLNGFKGDVVFVDTVSCLHRGSRNVKKERKILYATFNSRSSFRNPPFHKIIPFFDLGPNQYSTPLINLDPKLKFLDENAIN